MIASPPHGRKLGLVGVALTKARNNRKDVEALSQVRDEIEGLLIDSHYLVNAPFSWVTLSIRFGLKDDSTPSYGKINKRYGDLPLAIEVDAHSMGAASLEELKRRFKIATLIALIHAGQKYARPVTSLEDALSQSNGGAL